MFSGTGNSDKYFSIVCVSCASILFHLALLINSSTYFKFIPTWKRFLSSWAIDVYNKSLRLLANSSSSVPPSSINNLLKCNLDSNNCCVIGLAILVSSFSFAASKKSKLPHTSNIKKWSLGWLGPNTSGHNLVPLPIICQNLA